MAKMNSWSLRPEYQSSLTIIRGHFCYNFGEPRKMSNHEEDEI